MAGSGSCCRHRSVQCQIHVDTILLEFPVDIEIVEGLAITAAVATEAGIRIAAVQAAAF